MFFDAKMFIRSLKFLGMLTILSLSCTAIDVLASVSNGNDYADFLLKSRTPSLGPCLQYGLPLSYWVPDGYWEETDLKTSNIVQMTAEARYTAVTQMTLQTHAVNLYDSGLWMLSSVLLNHTERARAWMLFLSQADTCLQNPPGPSIRAPSSRWAYGAREKRFTGRNAFFFRMTAPYYMTQGVPEAFCEVSNSIGSEEVQPGWQNSYAEPCPSACGACGNGGVPSKNSQGLFYLFSDYRPVTGENAWISMIAPLQYDFLTHDPDRPGLQMALDALPAMRALQFELRGELSSVYYSPCSCKGMQCKPRTEAECELASAENAASAYAGAVMLMQSIPKTHAAYAEAGSLAEGIRRAFLHDFIVPEGLQISTVVDQQEKGPTVLCQPCIVSSLTVPRGSQHVQKSKVLAVDVFTWGLTVLHPHIDLHFGHGFSFKLWLSCRHLGGYTNSSLTQSGDGFAGVGYTYNKDANVLSGEWTLGAINMCEVLARFYESKDAEIAKDLRRDAHTMRHAVKSLLEVEIDMAGNGLQYGHQAHAGRIKTMLYATKRFKIPFGWWAHPHPSMASTVWQFLDSVYFNPLALGGQMIAPDHTDGVFK